MLKRPILVGGLLAILMGIGLTSLANYRYGSLAKAIAYLNGDIVQVDSANRDLGTVECAKAIKVDFTFTNLRSEPLKVVGANASCSCILPPDMPITLESFTATPITFTFKTPTEAQEFEQLIELYFDGEVSAMNLRISGVAR